MAKAQRGKPFDWEAEGRRAILDLLSERWVVPWAEAEARISNRGWKNFRKVQPLQLHGARRSLEAAGEIIAETTKHKDLPVSTIRLPFPAGKKDELKTLRGERRLLYRKYLSWAGKQDLCGKHAEKVVLASLQDAAGEAGLYVPTQAVGSISVVNDCGIERGPLDAWAHILTLPEVTTAASLVVEVKNVHRWIYPWMPELWELLVKAAELADCTPVLPLLVCVRSSYQTTEMAKDIGFFACQLRDQIFSPTIEPDEFAAVIDDFGLAARQLPVEPFEPVTSLLTKVLRMSPPLSPPYEQHDLEWHTRQVERFSVIAPIVLAHSALAGTLDDATRRRVFRSFSAAARSAFTWPDVKGW
jgi:hypothetical protein